MEPFEVRTTPARLKPSLLAWSVLLTVGGLWLVFLVARFVVLAARPSGDDADASRVATGAIVLAVATGMYFLIAAPFVQLLLAYLFRDRGKQVVAHRLDEEGWHHILAGSDVVVPWHGMMIAVTERAEERFRIHLVSDGPFPARSDPLSRHVRRKLRKQRGFSLPMTATNPTEDELAAAVQQQSGGRVFLQR
jgi:hypothetical protein